MGRLNKALERIKNREAANAPRATAAARNVSIGRKQPQAEAVDLAAGARTVRLNRVALAGNRIITDAIDPAVRTSYKMLRTRLLQTMRANGWQSVAVTSATQGDGKTVTAINLAISIASDVNHSVCLVDLDLRHSSIARYLDLSLKHGISDCLQRKLPLRDAILNPDIDRLLILPNHTTEAHSSEILSSPGMQDIVNVLTLDPGRIVIYDMPPVLAADDMLAFAPNVDAVLFIVAERVTARTDVMKACELLENVHIVGTILNRSDEKTAAYY